MNPNQQLNTTPPSQPLNMKPPTPTPTPVPGQPLQSQGMPAGAPQAAPELATPEERAQLDALAEATKTKMAELQASKFSNSNARDAAQTDILRELFTMMQEAGVDLTSPESVSEFIERMKEANPNMAADFEAAIIALLGDEELGQVEGEGLGDVPVDLNTPPESAFPQSVPGEAGPDVSVPPGGVTGMPLPGKRGPIEPNATPGNETLPQDLRGLVPPAPGA